MSYSVLEILLLFADGQYAILSLLLKYYNITLKYNTLVMSIPSTFFNLHWSIKYQVFEKPQSLDTVISTCFGEISNSNGGEYEDDYLLGCCAV
jgi:hypothetical protein